jgi:hypothetical protein
MMLDVLKFDGMSGSEPGMLGTKMFFPVLIIGW